MQGLKRSLIINTYEWQTSNPRYKTFNHIRSTLVCCIGCHNFSNLYKFPKPRGRVIKSDWLQNWSRIKSRNMLPFLSTNLLFFCLRSKHIHKCICLNAMYIFNFVQLICRRKCCIKNLTFQNFGSALNSGKWRSWRNWSVYYIQTNTVKQSFCMCSKLDLYKDRTNIKKLWKQLPRRRFELKTNKWKQGQKQRYVQVFPNYGGHNYRNVFNNILLIDP